MLIIDFLLRKHICDSPRVWCSTRRVGGSVGFSFNPYQTRPLRKFISRPFKGRFSLGQGNIPTDLKSKEFDFFDKRFKRILGGLFCPPVLEVKAKIYFLSPKIQIYVFLLPTSEKGLGKEKHGLRIKCKIKTNGIFERQ